MLKKANRSLWTVKYFLENEKKNSLLQIWGFFFQYLEMVSF